MSKRKILLVTGIFPPQIGGPATFISRIAQKLTEQYQYRVTVVCPPESSVAEFDDSLPYTVNRKNGLGLRLMLIKGLLKHRIILVNGLEQYVYPIARILRRPYVLKIVGDSVWQSARTSGKTSLDIDKFQIDENERQKFASLIEKRNRMALFARQVVTPSNYLRRMVIGWGVPPERVTTIPNGVELERFHHIQNKERSSGRLRVLFVGRLTNWKGVETLLLAMNHVDNVSLTIVGDGPELPHLIDLAKQLNIGERVEFTGRLSQDQVEKHMANAHVLVLTSLYEGMSHTLLEAMAAGLPCIASNRGGNEEIITSGKNGFLIEPQDVQALVTSLRQLESDEHLRQRLSEEARNRAMNFSIDRTVRDFVNLLVHQG